MCELCTLLGAESLFRKHGKNVPTLTGPSCLYHSHVVSFAQQPNTWGGPLHITNTAVESDCLGNAVDWGLHLYGTLIGCLVLAESSTQAGEHCP